MIMQILEEKNMSEFNFKSSACTDKIQSERLLALGLKKETADMYYQKLNDKWSPFVGQPLSYYGLHGTYLIPAWSLHRLLCLYGADYTIKEVYNNAEECYDMLICAIGIAIEDGDFNEDYLEK